MRRYLCEGGTTSGNGHSLGEDDPEWYDAANFKDSPHKLRSFHMANPLRLGPPKRLGIWVQCWEEDKMRMTSLMTTSLRDHTQEAEHCKYW
jgi:hypothetical protein